MEKRKDRGMRVAVSGIRGMIRLILFVVIAIGLIFLARETYQLGYSVFNQKPVDKGEGREVRITITEDMSVGEIGELLKHSGLIKEDLLVFRVQELVSDYHNKLTPGTYILRTGMTPDEMLRVLAGADPDNPAIKESNTENGTENSDGNANGNNANGENAQ